MKVRVIARYEIRVFGAVGSAVSEQLVSANFARIMLGREELPLERWAGAAVELESAQGDRREKGNGGKRRARYRLGCAAIGRIGIEPACHEMNEGIPDA